MEFKGPYVKAMMERAPKMFMALRRSGQLDAHLQAKSEEAELTADAPKLPNGLPREPYLREAEEQVFALLIEFPGESESTAT